MVSLQEEDKYSQHSRFFFFKQRTAYDMSLRDWSSDVCSSDLPSRRGPRHPPRRAGAPAPPARAQIGRASCRERVCNDVGISVVALSLKKKTRERHAIGIDPVRPARGPELPLGEASRGRARRGDRDFGLLG